MLSKKQSWLSSSDHEPLTVYLTHPSSSEKPQLVGGRLVMEDLAETKQFSMFLTISHHQPHWWKTPILHPSPEKKFGYLTWQLKKTLALPHGPIIAPPPASSAALSLGSRKFRNTATCSRDGSPGHHWDEFSEFTKSETDMKNWLVGQGHPVLKNMSSSILGWWNSQLNGKIKNGNQTTNQQ